MGTVTKKRVKDNNYYHYVESRRVNDKHRVINQVYLGTAEKLLKDTRKGRKPKDVKHQSFGDVAALYEISQRLGIIQAINSTVDKEVAGLSVGKYFLIAAISRACKAKSKNGIVK